MYWHLRTSGNLLALYGLIGNVTKGGATTFFGKVPGLTHHFFPNASEDQYPSCYETIRKSFHALRKLGWLKARSDGRYDFVTHDEWERDHPGECFKRIVLPWHDETDPLVKQLYALAGGKLRLFERNIAAIRKVGTDNEIIERFAIAMKEAELLRDQGKYTGTSPRPVFWRVYRELKAKKLALKSNT